LPKFVMIFAAIVVFAQMFMVGQHQAKNSPLDIFHRLRPLWRSLAPVLLLFPLVTFGVIVLLRPPPQVCLGLAILAASPGAPITTRRAMAAQADMSYVSTLQLTLALLAMVFSPITLVVFDLALDLGSPSITPGTVAGQVGVVTFLPAALGYLLSRLAPDFCRRYETIFSRAANALFVSLLVVVLLALIFVAELRVLLLIGWSGGLAVVLMAVLAIAFGHALGGTRADRRSGLAIATVARNLGLALYIADLSPASTAAIPTIMSYALAGFLLAFPYANWIKRQSVAATE